MPVLESTDRIAPKSVLRHRPIEIPQTEGEVAAPVTKRASRPGHASADVDEPQIVQWKRKTGDQAAPKQVGRKSSITTSAAKRLSPISTHMTRRKGSSAPRHPLFYLGLGMLGTVLLWMLLSACVSWVSTTLDDLHYGRPRTYQTDARVGHNDQNTPSHFIALNLNRRIQVIEIPGGDTSHTRIFTGPQLYGTGDDLVPATLSFVDVNGDGKLDMVIKVQESRVVLLNDQGSFRPVQPTERDGIERFLQQHSV